MKLPHLITGRLIRRYKRFLAEVELDSGATVTAHCPNTGSMLNCAAPGSRVWLRDAASPKRKLRYSWELVEVAGRYLACINTHRANALVREAIESNWIEPLVGYTSLAAEQRYGLQGSRIDFLLTADGRRDCYIEVKNVTLLRDQGQGTFPDAVTARGRKHLEELAAVAQHGGRAVLLFNVAHTGIRCVSPDWAIDPVYGDALANAVEAGVEVLAYGARITTDAIALDHRLPFDLHRP